MPQPTQHSLVCILLLWTTIISIVQVVFTILFFTTGRNGLSQNSSAVEPERIIQPPQHSTLSPSSEDELLLGKGKMLTFAAKDGKEDSSSKIKWHPQGTKADVILEDEGVLKIQKDGYFFLNLQVSSCMDRKESETLEHTVSLKSKNRVLLEGWINTKTNTTGVLSKIEEMPAGEELEVNINPPIKCINRNKSATHLDIIFMARHYV